MDQGTLSDNCGPGSTAFRFANTLWDIVDEGPNEVIGWNDDGLSFVVSLFSLHRTFALSHETHLLFELGPRYRRISKANPVEEV
jgi:hypothetical protein